jgi:ADP-heptose:LPS heptosyltransferase
MMATAPVDYNNHEMILERGKSYIMNPFWSQKLPCQNKPCIVPNYTLDIDLTDKSILFIRAMGRGDILFLTPLINIIKARYPTCKIGMATVEDQHDLLMILDNIDTKVLYPIAKEEFESYDYYFQVSGLVEGNPENKPKNVYETYLKHLAGDKIELEITPEMCRPFIKPNLLNGFKPIYDKMVAIHPFAQDPIRSINPHSIKNLCTKLTAAGYKVMIVGTKIEYDMYKHILTDPDLLWSFKFAADIATLTRVLAFCKYVVATDSFIVHLAQSVEVPTICVYGPFPSESRVKHYKNIYVMDSNPECRCMKHQLGRCPKGFQSPPCLAFDSDTILNIIEFDDPQIVTDLSTVILEPTVQEYNWRLNDEEETV